MLEQTLIHGVKTQIKIQFEQQSQWKPQKPCQIYIHLLDVML